MSDLREVRIEDFGPVELAYAEAMHEDCPEVPPGHPLAAHSPWSGSDLDGTESWQEFTDRLARHGLVLVTQDELAEALTVERLTTVLYDWMPEGADVSVGFDGDTAHLTGADLARFIFDRDAEYARLRSRPSPTEEKG